MARRSKQAVPIRDSGKDLTASIHMLDRFTESDLETWQKRSKELDELYDTFYHSLEPERIRRRDEITNALNSKSSPPFEFKNWVRMFEYRWANSPLSAAGSVVSYGGRFNIGSACDESGAAVIFPALYIGDSPETAYREFYQISKDQASESGLTEADFCLRKSDISVRLNGRIERVFDMRDPKNLTPIAQVLSKFKPPENLNRLAKIFKLGDPKKLLIRTPAQLQSHLLGRNWRAWPAQFGLPSPSQRFGLMLKSAGFEGVIYNSTKMPGKACIAVFPSNIDNENSFVELSDPPPPTIEYNRLDANTAEGLCGWEHVRKKDQHR